MNRHERRQARRSAVELVVSLKCGPAKDPGDLWLFGRTRNVSTGGMCLRTRSLPAALEAGMPVELYCLPDSGRVHGKEPIPVHIRARVVWQRPEKGLLGLRYA